MFFWDKVEPEFFFENKKAIFRVGKKICKHKKYKHLYGGMIFRAYSIVKDRLNIDIPYFSHHNADSYVKSSFLRLSMLAINPTVTIANVPNFEHITKG